MPELRAKEIIDRIATLNIFCTLEEAELNAFEIASMSIEKQIPKQPTDIRQHVDHKTGCCPLCNTKLAHFGDMNYCHKCGVKLDWEVEDATN